MSDNRFGVDVNRWRWLILFVFVPGFVGPSARLGLVDSSFWFLNLMCAGACALLLTRLDRPLERTLWMWIWLAIFLAGYFIKTYVVASNLGYWKGEAEYFYELKPVMSAEVLAKAFRWITVAFVAFCALAWALPSAGVSAASQASAERLGTRYTNMRLLLIFTLLVSVGVAAARLIYGVGIHGVEGSDASTRLPYRLGSLIVRTEENFLPAIILLLLWAADRSKKSGLATAALIIGFVNAFLTSFVSTSKGALIFQFEAPIFLLSILTGRLSRGRVVALTVVAVFTVAIYPMLMTLRSAQAAHGGGLGASGIITTLTQPSPDQGQLASKTSFQNEMQTTAQKYLMRVTGADGVWMCLGRPAGVCLDRGRAALMSGSSLGEYYGRVVVGRKDLATFDAPGMLAAFMLLGGWLGVLLLLPIAVVLVWAVWWMLSQFSTRPVAQAIAAVFLFGFLSEGAFRPQNLVVFVVTLVLCEWTFWWLMTPRSGKPVGRARKVPAWTDTLPASRGHQA